MKDYLIVIVLLSAILLAGCTARQSPGGKPGTTAQMRKVPEVTDRQFQQAVLDNPQPVLVDFYAPWCSACARLEPEIEQIAGRYKGKLKIVRVNVDDNPRLAQRFHIEAIPHLIIFKDGDVVDEMMGVPNQNQLSSTLNRTL